MILEYGVATSDEPMGATAAPRRSGRKIIIGIFMKRVDGMLPPPRRFGRSRCLHHHIILLASQYSLLIVSRCEKLCSVLTTAAQQHQHPLL
mmetsp:Transcript_5055/g.8326  ORF Transcript_5055/g.8326 Transcript_5055/m.8326 type:complete len:91 (+) Transcript_5055:839-1111(+)